MSWVAMGEMSEYAVRFEIRPAPVLRTHARFRALSPRKARTVVTNLPIAQTGLEEVTTGLQLDVFLKATDLDDALGAATAVAEDFAAELSLLAAARCGTPTPRIVVDEDQSREAHGFRQYTPVDFGVSRRRLTPKAIQFFRSTVENLDAEHRTAVKRSIHAYHQALKAIDPLVEFLLLWVSLEALDGFLSIRLRLRNHKHLDGIRTLLEAKIHDGAAFYKEANALRNRFVHGSRDMQALTGNAAGLVGRMRIVARNAIAWAIHTHWEGDERPLKYWPVTFVIEFTLEAPKGAPLGRDGDLPYVHVGSILPTDLTKDGSNIGFLTRIKIEERFGPDVTKGASGRAWLAGEQVDLGRLEFVLEDGTNFVALEGKGPPRTSP